MKRYYSIMAYADTGFPKFMDSYKTLAQVRKVAAELIKDGYTLVEIKYDSKIQGAFKDLIETVTA